VLNKYPVITKLVCVALVVTVMLPAGQILFPMIGHAVGETPFNAVEAVVSATLGLGLYAVLFG
jgi:hypothetical protein